MTGRDRVVVLSLLALSTFVAIEVLANIGQRVPAGTTPALGGTAEATLVNSSSGLPAPERDLATIRATLMRDAAGSYIDDVLLGRDSTLVRWIERRSDAVRVWVDEHPSATDVDPSFPSAVRQAFDAWSTAGLPLSFTYVADSASAEVRVTFRERLDEPISGRTRWIRDSNWWITGGDIELALRTPTARAVTREQLHAIALHEIGHLLGLDHTTDTLAIMAPRVRALDLTAADIATLRLVYRVPPGPVRAP